jgi:hypothetical protein
VKDAVILLMTANAYAHIVANLKAATVALAMTKQLVDEKASFHLECLLGETSWQRKNLTGWRVDRKEAV